MGRFGDVPGPPSVGEMWPFAKWFIWAVAVIIVVSLVLGALGWALGWITLPARVVNPEETLARWRWFYDTYEGLQGLAANIEQAEKSLDDFEELHGDPNGWTWQDREEHQRLVSVRDGYLMNYNRVAAQYNAKMRDITRSYIRPPDLRECIPNWGTETCIYRD